MKESEDGIGRVPIVCEGDFGIDLGKVLTLLNGFFPEDVGRGGGGGDGVEGGDSMSSSS